MGAEDKSRSTENRPRVARSPDGKYKGSRGEGARVRQRLQRIYLYTPENEYHMKPLRLRVYPRGLSQAHVAEIRAVSRVTCRRHPVFLRLAFLWPTLINLQPLSTVYRLIGCSGTQPFSDICVAVAGGWRCSSLVKYLTGV